MRQRGTVRHRHGPWAAIALALAACQPTAPAPLSAAQPGVPALRGHVSDLIPARSTQATLGNVAQAATVSLINATTGVTAASAVTDGAGNFTLTFGNGFRPLAGQPYYLEAVKGLPAGGLSNRAGASLARVRTIVFYQSGGWNTMTGLAVQLGVTTTTISAIASLKGLNTSDQQTLLSSVNGAVFSPTASISLAEFNAVFPLESAALAVDQDPLEAVGYDPTGAGPATQYLPKPGNLVLFDTYGTGLGGAIATPSGTITINGQNLPLAVAQATVSLGPVPVATWSTNAARTQMAATLSATAYGGVVQVSSGASTWTGPFIPVSGTVGTMAGQYNGYADGRGAVARFGAAQGLAIDRTTGNLFVADNSNQVIRKVTAAGIASTYAGTGNWGWLDGPAASARFGTPIGVAFEQSTGNVYVADDDNNRIRTITPAGAVSTLAGSGTSGSGDGSAATATFNAPYSVAVDGSGNVYVGDRGNLRIRKVAGGVVSTFAGSTGGYVDGPGATAKFGAVNGIAVDSLGNVYVADSSNNVIRRITPAGVVSTFAGSGTAGFQDGATSSARFNWPIYVGVDQNDAVYVSDSNNNTIRKIAGGVVSTIAGVGPTVSAEADGPARQAGFASLYALAVDNNGVVYVLDRYSYRIRAVAP